jgi:hypothetical protein
MNYTKEKIQFTPTAAQLKGALQHIHYEIAQLLVTLIAIRNDEGCALCRKRLSNALLESRLIHVRTLLDFFQMTPKRRCEKDYVLSSDYGFRSQTIDMPPRCRQRLNKDLAHLTYSRSEYQTKWPVDQIVLPILTSCSAFCEHLISFYLPTNCSDQLERWTELLNWINTVVKSIKLAASE